MIRKATINDIEQTAKLSLQLHDLHVKAKPESYREMPAEFFQGKLEWYVREENTEILVNDDNGINAFAAVKLMDVEPEDRFPRRLCYIDCFAVDEKCRRQGVGKKLMEYIGEFAKENGCTSLQLGVAAFNENAREFYRAMGFGERTIIMEQKFN
ncbi:MAG: GNAT family N-acetyltransferase [Acutalibacter sp.]|nr:GNAT family N-acetyltransferase [Acutalibacter sp.]